MIKRILFALYLALAYGIAGNCDAATYAFICTDEETNQEHYYEYSAPIRYDWIEEQHICDEMVFVAE